MSESISLDRVAFGSSECVEDSFWDLQDLRLPNLCKLELGDCSCPDALPIDVSDKLRSLSLFFASIYGNGAYLKLELDKFFTSPEAFQANLTKLDFPNAPATLLEGTALTTFANVKELSVTQQGLYNHNVLLSQLTQLKR